jgi:hypothetical protein
MLSRWRSVLRERFASMSWARGGLAVSSGADGRAPFRRTQTGAVASVGGRRGRLLPLLLSLMLLLPAPLFADELMQIRDGEVRLDDGVYLLDARIHYELSDAAREALDNGVPLVVVLQIEVQRSRWWWWNAEVAVLEQRYRLQYHALSERYVVTALNSGESRSFRSLDTLLAELGRIQGLPVIDAGLLDPDEHYIVRARVGLDIDALPRPLRAVAYISPEWQLTSDWQSWSLGS